MNEPPLPQRLQQLATEIEALDSGHARALLQTVLDFHAAGLTQLLGLIAAEGDSGRAILEKASRDGLVRNLLLLHGLHPADIETRVNEAFDQVRPLLRSQGADVELVAIADDAVRLHLHRGGDGYPASVQVLRAAVEEAIGAIAPDVRLIEFVEPGTAATTSRLPLPVLARPGGERPMQEPSS